MRSALRWILPILLFLAGSGVGFAQGMNAGDIRGTVTDSTGALIPGVKVTVLNVDTGVTKSFVSNDAGLYDTSSIVTGNYTVTFEKQGFEQFVRGPITLQVGYTTVNAKLQVGATTAQVTVTSDVPLLSTESGEHTVTMSDKDMEQLPQVAGGAGEDWQTFMILMPGASGTPGGAQGAANPGQAVSINGSLPYNNVLADGASTTLSHSQNANPAIFEDVSELQVSLSNFSAQYGVGGAIINQISKGGTSEFHGSAYEFLQNNYFSALGYQFNNPGAKVPYLRFNNFGGNVGGPVDTSWDNLKKKMFFFFGYDQIVDHGAASNQVNSIPTPAVMSGDFTGELPIYDPTTQTIAYDPQGNPYPVRKSFQSEYGSNQVPAALMDPVAKAFEQFYPTPSNHIADGDFVPSNTIGTDGETQNNFIASVPQSTPYRKYFGRLDYDTSVNNRLSMSDTQSDTPVVYPSGVTAYPIGWQGGDVDNNNAQITDVWNIRTNIINEARMGYTWQGSFFTDLSLNQGYPSKLGWQFAEANTIPAIQFYRFYPYAWIQPSSNAEYKEHVFDPSDVVTIIADKHILHFGGEVLIYRDNSTAWGNTNAGTMGFGGGYTEQWDHTACGPNAYAGQMCPDTSTGLEYADFLLGLSSNWSANVSPEYGARLKTPQFFVQDDYKVRPNLTLNLGFRYQFNTGWSEIHNNEASFDPTITNMGPSNTGFTYTAPNGSSITNPQGGWWFGTTHTNGRNQLIAPVYTTFMPRVGASWQPMQNMTVRGGVGVYAYTWSLDNYGGNNSSYGMGAALSKSGSVGDQTNGITPIVKLGGNGNEFVSNAGSGLVTSSTPLPYTSGSTASGAYNGQGAGFVLYHIPVPRMIQYNLAVQYAFTTNLMAEAAYVGSHGANLIYATDLNAIPQQFLSSNDVALGYRPYPWFQGLSGSTNNGISNYNSLQASITKRMTKGLSFSANYVWSHMLDNQDSSGWGSREGPQNWQIANNLQANYSNSNFDVRQAFKGYGIYALPFGKGQMFLANSNALLDAVAGGWQVSATVVAQTGQPFTVFGDQNTYQQAGSAFPNWNPGVSWKPVHQSARCEVAVSGTCMNEWYNPAAFTRPANGTFGNVRRNALYGPDLSQVNLSAGKNFLLPWRKMQFQFRMDASNAFNHASFNLPNGVLGGAAGVGDPYSFGMNDANGQNGGTTQQIGGTTVGGRTIQFDGKLTF